MMRHRLARKLFREFIETTKWEKLVLILPFIVLAIDTHIFYFALLHQETAILISSGFVLVLSLIEIIVALKEIHTHFTEARKDAEIQAMVVDGIQSFNQRPTVSQVLWKISDSECRFSRHELYPFVCDAIASLFPDDDDE